MKIIQQTNLDIENTIKEAQKNNTHNDGPILFLVNNLIDVQDYIDTKFGKVDKNFISKFIIPDNPNVKIIPQLTINGNTYTKFININLQPFGTIYFVEKDIENVSN